MLANLHRQGDVVQKTLCHCLWVSHQDSVSTGAAWYVLIVTGQGSYCRAFPFDCSVCHGQSSVTELVRRYCFLMFPSNTTEVRWRGFHSGPKWCSHVDQWGLRSRERTGMGNWGELQRGTAYRGTGCVKWSKGHATLQGQQQWERLPARPEWEKGGIVPRLTAVSFSVVSLCT